MGVAATAAPPRPVPTGLYIGALALAAVALVALTDVAPAVGGPLWALPILVVLIALAERLHVRARYGQHASGMNLVEAVLPPLLLAYPAGQVAAAVALGQAGAAVASRNHPLKAAFNIAQWTLAAVVGSICVSALTSRGAWAEPFGVLKAVAALLLGLALVALVNKLAFTGVLAVSTGRRNAQRLDALCASLFGTGQLLGLGVNAAVGVLTALAFTLEPTSVVLFVVPLLVLHRAALGSARDQLDEQHIATLRSASAELSAALDPQQAFPSFLRALQQGVQARAATLTLRQGDAWRLLHVTRPDLNAPARTAVLSFEAGTEAAHRCEELQQAVSAGPQALRAALERLTGTAVTDVQVEALDDGGGILAVSDRDGLVGHDRQVQDLLELLAREAGRALTRSGLLQEVLTERSKLDELVSAASDGIFSLDSQGTVRTWNPAIEAMTGLACEQVLDRPGALTALTVRDGVGAPVNLTGWQADDVRLPRELVLTGPGGTTRVRCSYSRTQASEPAHATLVVVARDVSITSDLTELREQFQSLVRADAAQRVVVEHLQHAVMPELTQDRLGGQVAVAYVSADPTEPSGGDIYDCQVLPDGTFHLAVVDVLGHGVHATQDALAVMHTLRTLAFDGEPLERIVERADLLLGRRDADVVATAVLARYDPATGALAVANGGHPPAFVVDSECVVELDSEGGAIGWPGAGTDTIARTVLQPGQSLLLYTDGLVEVGHDLLAGLDRLQDTARRTAQLPVQKMVDALLQDALTVAGTHDDMLALVLRRPCADAPVPLQHERPSRIAQADGDLTSA